ncbi:MAG: hypothetical protein ACXW3E_02600 [Thermoanaerobaculia bacterium]
MFELLALLVAGAACVAAVAITVLALKVAFHVTFWTMKLLLLPFVVVAVLVKLTLLAALAAAVLAVIIPIAIVLVLIATPFLLLGALS